MTVDLYRAVTLPGSPTIGYVYGGQLLGQALAAASKSVDPALLAHSLHSYFLRTGDTYEPLIYQVHRLRDGHSFATRCIKAIQKGHTIFLMMASFQVRQIRCVAAYASDIRLLNVSLRPHRDIAGYNTRSLSLDHSMWFHKSFRADEWLLHVFESPRVSNGRGLALGKIFTRSGELVVSTAQEGVIRMIDKSKVKTKSKL
ncbi:hypothetical protein L7F22_058132 [Adiantum nelumboides]|nr:hypothetical protein [Adiantum nelumboides]